MQLYSTNLEVEEEKDFMCCRHLFEDRNPEETSVNSPGCEKFAPRAA